jgi:hypothetical protein
MNKSQKMKLWWIFQNKLKELGLGKNKKSIKIWLEYLESNGIQVRKSKEHFYVSEKVVSLAGFSVRPSWKIGIPNHLAFKILVLGL